jgi:antitoxin FitA
MAAITVRNLKDEAHRALKARAKRNARSTEAELRAIIEEAVLPKKQAKGLGTTLYELGRKYGPLEFERDKTPMRVVKFD